MNNVIPFPARPAADVCTTASNVLDRALRQASAVCSPPVIVETDDEDREFFAWVQARYRQLAYGDTK